MRLINALSEQRRRQIFGHAEPHLREDEEIVHWVRAKRHGSRGEGFAYLTPRRLLVVITGRHESHESVWFDSIRSWGVDLDARAGPLLAVACGETSVYVHMPVATTATATNVRDFLTGLRAHAPVPKRPFESEMGTFRASVDVPVAVQRRSVYSRTRKGIVTVLGILLLLSGLAIVPLPGPWSVPIVLAALALLASEYDWAKDLRQWSKEKVRKTRKRFARRSQGESG